MPETGFPLQPPQRVLSGHIRTHTSRAGSHTKNHQQLILFGKHRQRRWPQPRNSLCSPFIAWQDETLAWGVRLKLSSPQSWRGLEAHGTRCPAEPQPSQEPQGWHFLYAPSYVGQDSRLTAPGRAGERTRLPSPMASCRRGRVSHPELLQYFILHP